MQIVVFEEDEKLYITLVKVTLPGIMQVNDITQALLQGYCAFSNYSFYVAIVAANEFDFA